MLGGNGGRAMEAGGCNVLRRRRGMRGSGNTCCVERRLDLRMMDAGGSELCSIAKPADVSVMLTMKMRRKAHLTQ